MIRLYRKQDLILFQVGENASFFSSIHSWYGFYSFFLKNIFKKKCDQFCQKMREKIEEKKQRENCHKNEKDKKIIES